MYENKVAFHDHVFVYLQKYRMSDSEEEGSAYSGSAPGSPAGSGSPPGSPAGSVSGPGSPAGSGGEELSGVSITVPKEVKVSQSKIKGGHSVPVSKEVQVSHSQIKGGHSIPVPKYLSQNISSQLQIKY